MTDDRYIPTADRVVLKRTRLEHFERLNDWVRSKGGWVVSVPGHPIARIQTLPDSGLPAELTALGYELEPCGQTQRILAGARTQRLGVTSSGAYFELAEGSTAPVAQMVRHDGPTPVDVFEFIYDPL